MKKLAMMLVLVLAIICSTAVAESDEVTAISLGSGLVMDKFSPTAIARMAAMFPDGSEVIIESETMSVIYCRYNSALFVGMIENNGDGAAILNSAALDFLVDGTVPGMVNDWYAEAVATEDLEYLLPYFEIESLSTDESVSIYSHDGSVMHVWKLGEKSLLIYDKATWDYIDRLTNDPSAAEPEPFVDDDILELGDGLYCEEVASYEFEEYLEKFGGCSELARTDDLSVIRCCKDGAILVFFMYFEDGYTRDTMLTIYNDAAQAFLDEGIAPGTDRDWYSESLDSELVVVLDVLFDEKEEAAVNEDTVFNWYYELDSDAQLILMDFEGNIVIFYNQEAFDMIYAAAQ